MSKRKTVEVEWIKDRMNYLLKHDVDQKGKPATSLVSRQMTCIWIEAILTESGNYRGFRYLNQSEVPEGELPGIEMPDPFDGGAINYPDEYRRHYI